MFNQPGAISTGGAALKVGNIKQVWGTQAEPAGAEPAKERKQGEISHYAENQIKNALGLNNPAPKKKEEPPKPVDKKKEALRNALFTGISNKKKDSSDSDDDKKEVKKTEEPTAEMNLLDFDDGPAVSSNPTNLLDTDNSAQ